MISTNMAEEVTKKGMIKIIHLNVGGVKYDTTSQTLQLSKFFKVLLNEETAFTPTKIGKRYFVDASGLAFEHVLQLLRNPNYLFPEEYLQDLKFYDVDIEPNIRPAQNTQWEKLMEKLNDLANQMDTKDEKYCRHEGCYRERYEYFQYCTSHGQLVGSDYQTFFEGCIVTVKGCGLGKVTTFSWNDAMVKYWFGNEGWCEKSRTCQKSNLTILDQIAK